MDNQGVIFNKVRLRTARLDMSEQLILMELEVDFQSGWLSGQHESKEWLWG